MSKIYVASSWRNRHQPWVVAMLVRLKHEVYDFRMPSKYAEGFQWSRVDPEWQTWTPEEYRAKLATEEAERGFALDFNAMQWADECVLVLPSGSSSHAEAGWMAGKGKPVTVYMPDQVEPELMYKMFDQIVLSDEELRERFAPVNA